MLVVSFILLLNFSAPLIASSEKSKVSEGKMDSAHEFRIQGQITAVSGSGTIFVVGGQTIVIDPTRVAGFKQKGIIVVGNMVKVEGITINGTMLAKDINVVGTGQGRFQLEVAANPAVGIGTTVTPATQGEIKVKAIGPVDQVSTFLNQVIVFLKNLI